MSARRKVPAMSWEEQQFHTDTSRGGAILADLDYHLECDELVEAKEYDRQLQLAAKAFGIKRYRGVPCGHEGHGRLRHTASAVCCHCVKVYGATRLAKERELREQRRLVTAARSC